MDAAEPSEPLADDAAPPAAPVESPLARAGVSAWARVRAVDAAIDEQIDTIRNPALDALFYGLSGAADHSVLWHTLGSATALVRGDRRLATAMTTALGIESFLTNVVIKSAFRRVRPDRYLDPPSRYRIRTPVTSSFPSGHATAAFTAAAFLSEGGRRHAGWWYGLAALVAGSRVYVRMHHTSDVVAGAALGVAFGAILRRALLRRGSR